ncbi:hypothetical protein GCM10027273_06360 [Nocardioides pakistanensis]
MSNTTRLPWPDEVGSSSDSAVTAATAAVLRTGAVKPVSRIASSTGTTLAAVTSRGEGRPVVVGSTPAAPSTATEVTATEHSIEAIRP